MKTRKVMVFTLCIAALMVQTAAAENLLGDSSLYFGRPVRDSFLYEYNGSSIEIELRAEGFTPEFEVLTECAKISLLGLHHPEFLHTMGLFPDSFWTDTGLSTGEIIRVLRNNDWSFTVSTTDRPVRIVTDFADQLFVAEDNPGSNIFLEYQSIDKVVPNLGNTVLHELIHLAPDYSWDTSNAYHGFIHFQNYYCNLDVQRSVPYTFGNTFDLFLRDQLKRLKNLQTGYGYDDIAAFLQRENRITTPEDNPFLTEFVIDNRSREPIRRISVTYKYTGCSDDIRYTFESGKNFFHHFDEIDAYGSGSVFVVPIYYWGIESLTINGDTFYFGGLFPFGGDFPYCSTIAGRRVDLRYRGGGQEGLVLVGYEEQRW